MKFGLSVSVSNLANISWVFVTFGECRVKTILFQ
jgi:hypothetical protein